MMVRLPHSLQAARQVLHGLLRLVDPAELRQGAAEVVVRISVAGI
jgi:hypothetical protein